MVIKYPQGLRLIHEPTDPDLDSRTISQATCSLIDDLLVRPLQVDGRLTDLDMSTVEQIKSTILILGQKAGTLEDWIEGTPQKDQVN